MVKVAILKVYYNVYEVEGDLVISRAMSYIFIKFYSNCLVYNYYLIILY